MLKALRSLRAEQGGFTLVEVLVLIAVVSIMAGATVTMIATEFDSPLKAQQYFDQTTTINNMFGFLSSRLAVAQTPIGQTKTTNCPNGISPCTDPLSIAGDQVMFASGGLCYRVFYVKALKQIRATTAGNCSDPSIDPVRGPNETITDDGSCSQAPCHSGTSYYDQALDQSSDSYVLASAVNQGRPGTAPSSYPSPLQVLQYEDSGNGALSVDANACVLTNPSNPVQPCSHTSWYTTPNTMPYTATNSQVNFVTATLYDDSASIASASHVATVATRAYQQQLPLSQVCAAGQSGYTGSAPGTVIDHQRIEHQSSSSSTSLSANASGFANVTLSTGAVLESQQITTANVWVFFQGALTVQSSGGSPFTIRADLQTDRGGTWHSVASDNPGGGDANGRPYFYWVEPTTAAATDYPFKGAFQLPENTGSSDPAGTHYRIVMEIGDNAGAVTLVRGSAVDQWTPWLDVDVVAY